MTVNRKITGTEQRDFGHPRIQLLTQCLRVQLTPALRRDHLLNDDDSILQYKQGRVELRM